MGKYSALMTFWYETTREGRRAQYGVTAHSYEDATQLLRAAGYPLEPGVAVAVREEVTIDQLDQRHVVPNMGPMQVRGVWFPRRNL
jgi:hypothetical protein